MTIKKILVLAAMALTAVAFAMPATASAETDVWTVGDGLEGHETLGEEEVATQSFEGFILLTAPPWIPQLGLVHTLVGCPVTIVIQAEGPSGGQINSFTPTTAECSGNGIFTGCIYTHHTTNPPWAINIASTSEGITAGPITVHNEFQNGTCNSGINTTHMVFDSVSLTPTLNYEGTIKEIHISGTSVGGIWTTSGSVAPEEDPETDLLGIETVP